MYYFKLYFRKRSHMDPLGLECACGGCAVLQHTQAAGTGRSLCVFAESLGSSSMESRLLVSSPPLLAHPPFHTMRPY